MAVSSSPAAAATSSSRADRKRNVVARFPSLEAAVACYNSPRYQEALSHAKGASERDLVVVEEIAP
jgi:uncharacterized protein (DUF1330 family)